MPDKTQVVDSKQDRTHTICKENSSHLIEGEDFYFDDGFMVLTSKYLKKRGYCCQNDCRHCPYGTDPLKNLKDKEIESP